MVVITDMTFYYLSGATIFAVIAILIVPFINHKIKKENEVKKDVIENVEVKV